MHAVDKALERGWVRRLIVADVVVAEQFIEDRQVVLVNNLLVTWLGTVKPAPPTLAVCAVGPIVLVLDVLDECNGCFRIKLPFGQHDLQQAPHL